MVNMENTENDLFYYINENFEILCVQYKFRYHSEHNILPKIIQKKLKEKINFWSNF